MKLRQSILGLFESNGIINQNHFFIHCWNKNYENVLEINLNKYSVQQQQTTKQNIKKSKKNYNFIPNKHVGLNGGKNVYGF